MTDTAPVTTMRRPAGGVPWKIPAAVVAVLLMLLAAWLFWPDDEPSVAVPSKVCQKSLPGRSVKTLLPERGEKFQERNAYNFGSAGRDPRTMKKWGLGQCLLTGGGATVKVEYRLLQGGDYSRDDIERDARKDGSTPLALGDAAGYLEGNGSHLFASCPVRADGDDLLEVSVAVGGEGVDMKDRDVRSSAATLAADSMRHVAQDIRRCAAAERLPSGAPRVG